MHRPGRARRSPMRPSLRTRRRARISRRALLLPAGYRHLPDQDRAGVDVRTRVDVAAHRLDVAEHRLEVAGDGDAVDGVRDRPVLDPEPGRAARVVAGDVVRSEEPTSDLQSLMRLSYAVFCLHTKNPTSNHQFYCS